MAEDAASWYQRKLAAMRGQAPAQRPFQQPQYPQYTPQQPQVHPQEPAGGTFSGFLDLQRNGQALRPGKGARLNPEPCPNCGGSLYYADYGMKRKGPPPAPHCFNCGYNDLFEQGLQSTWEGGG